MKGFEVDVTVDTIHAAWDGTPGLKTMIDVMNSIDPAMLMDLWNFAVISMGDVLPEKMQHLLGVAIDIVPTHLFAVGANAHAKLALQTGATSLEVAQTIAIAGFVGARGYDASLDVIAAASEKMTGSSRLTRETLSAEQTDLKSELSARLGYWAEWMDKALLASPRYLRALLNFGYPASSEGLDPKSRELIIFGLYACPAHSDRPAMALHAEQALRQGATEDELLAVAQYVAIIGSHAITEGFIAVGSNL